MSHDTKKTNCNKYSLRTPEFYNRWRKMFLFLVTHIFYMIRFKLVYRLEVQGKENIPKDNSYIIAANHLSTLDPPLVCGVMNRGVAYMAKKELFEIRFCVGGLIGWEHLRLIEKNSAFQQLKLL